ncbi:MAG: ABC transporter permease [Candidatus Peribacteraceae bacterium]|nr:ABC transporter permease [Candidatus Peribacteraceae bacterium]
MNLLENIRGALGAIVSNKLRSSLTMLGIVIGVASVVLMVAIGQGAQRSVTSQIQSLGTNLLTISPGSPSQTNVRGATGGASASALTMEDVAALKEHVTGLSGLAPSTSTRGQVVVGANNASTTVLGATADYATVRNTPVAIGRFVTDADVEQVAKVVVLGSTVVQNVFPNNPQPIGEDIRIQGTIFTVVGVLTSKGSTGFQNADDQVIVPLTTLQQRLTGQKTVSTISASVADPEQMEQAQAVITAVLMNSHGLTDPAKQDFTVLNQADAVETLNQVTQIFTLLLGGIAGISLLVGGIGVMNIMLVSVTERTREIGIRKAIGAKKKDILLQFLIEATVLSVLGGAIGVAISAVVSFGVKTFFAFDASISAMSVVLALLFSIGVGIFFGLLPAWQAAKLRPIQALRYE